MFNLRTGTKLKTVSLEILVMLQSRNFYEVPVQSVFLYFRHNIIHRINLFTLCFSKKEMGSHLINPPIPPKSNPNPILIRRRWYSNINKSRTRLPSSAFLIGSSPAESKDCYTDMYITTAGPL